MAHVASGLNNEPWVSSGLNIECAGLERSLIIGLHWAPTKMSTTFAFGKSGIEVQVPDDYDCAVIESRYVKPLADANGALQHALDHPLASAPIGDLAKGKKRVAIVVCDITRPAPNSLTLPPLLDRLHRSGISHDGITILIATGLHRAATSAEVDQIRRPRYCEILPGHQQRCAGHRATSLSGSHRPRNPHSHSQRFRRCGPTHHPGLYRAAFDGGLFGGKKAGCSGSRSGTDDQGHSLPLVHARTPGHRRVHRRQSPAQ